jgi:hypothetical protein
MGHAVSVASAVGKRYARLAKTGKQDWSARVEDICCATRQATADLGGRRGRGGGTDHCLSGMKQLIPGAKDLQGRTASHACSTVSDTGRVKR